MASKGQIRLKSAWRPTSLIGVINGREDLSDIEKVRRLDIRHIRQVAQEETV